MQKKLYRSPKDGIVLGVSSGLGHYFEKDPVLVRIIFVILFFVTGYWPVLLAYGILFFIIPVDPAQAKVESSQEPKDVTSDDEERSEPSEQTHDVQDESSPTEPSSAVESEPERESEQEQKEPEPIERMDSGQNM